MTESVDDPAATAAAERAAAAARKRKERREAKIKAGGSDRLNKISGVGGGLQRESSKPSPSLQPTASTPKDHADPDEVDISEHFYEPRVTQRIPAGGDRIPNSAVADAQLRELLALQQQQPNPFLFGDGTANGANTANAAGAAGLDANDPMAAMLNQMMAAMGGAGAGGGGPGGPGGGGFPAGAFPGMPGFPPSPTAGLAAQQQTAPPRSASSVFSSVPAALWRLVHFAVAVSLGLYVAFATPFAGTQSEREAAAAAAGDAAAYGSDEDTADFLLHKRYFFYAFATAETVLLTSRFFVDKGLGGVAGGAGGGGGAGAGMLSMGLGILPPVVKQTIQVGMRYWQIFSTVRSDLLVCIFVLGVCAWWRG